MSSHILPPGELISLVLLSAEWSFNPTGSELHDEKLNMITVDIHV